MSSLLSEEEIEQQKINGEINDITNAIQTLKEVKKDTQSTELFEPVIDILKAKRKKLKKTLDNFSEEIVQVIEASAILE